MTFLFKSKKAVIRKKQPERIELIKVVHWVRSNTSLPIIHIANERKTTEGHGLLFKKMGVTPGVPDLFIPRAFSEYHGLWVEMKSAYGKASEEQIDFIQKMRAEMYRAEICYSAEEAISLIQQCFT